MPKIGKQNLFPGKKQLLKLSEHREERKQCSEIGVGGRKGQKKGGEEERKGRGTDSGQSGKTISFCLLRYLLLLCPSPFSLHPPLCPGAFFARIFLSPKDTFSFRSAAHSKLHTAKRRGGGICLLLIPPEMDDPALQRAKAKGIEGEKKDRTSSALPFLKRRKRKTKKTSSPHTHTHVSPSSSLSLSLDRC